MLPKPPPRRGPIGFLYAPPYRVQGISVAGEQTVVTVPELDLAFDIGLCPRFALPSQWVAVSHGHMDHIAALPYYFSQRTFQKMTTGNCICHAALAPAISRMMEAWVDVEQQRTPHNIIPLLPDEQIEIKNNHFLRAIEVSHTSSALGYAVVEKRSKLKPEYHDVPQSRLRELKMQGEEITYTREIPLIAYTGDTQIGPFLYRDEFAAAQIVIAECTFFDPEHRSRSRAGKHIHVEDLPALLEAWQADAVVLVHASRRTHMSQVRQHLARVIGQEQLERVFLLMDHHRNRQRYEAQLAEAREQVAEATST